MAMAPILPIARAVGRDHMARRHQMATRNTVSVGAVL